MQFKEAKKFILSKLETALSPQLSYHSAEHTIDVYEAAKELAKNEGVSGDDLTLLLTAAMYHDSGFLIDQKEHETLSCQVARQHLPAYGYSAGQLEKICGMIMATQIPQQPRNQLEEILCDADLDYLGRDDFFSIGDKLYAELRMFGIVNNENDWNILQAGFLEKHHYFTKTAINLRKHKKEEHLLIVRSKIHNSASA